MLSVLTLDMGRDLGDPRPVTIAGEGQTVYGNGRSLYVTGTDVPAFRGTDVVTGGRDVAGRETTYIHRFDVGGGARPRYTASGSVPGRLLNQYSMSEHEGRLRIATTVTPPPTAVRPDAPTSSTGSPTSSSNSPSGTPAMATTPGFRRRSGGR